MWKEKLAEMLPLLGHRNQILIVDKAFPLQTAEGVTMLDTGQSLADVLLHVIGEIGRSPHIRPMICTDAELQYMNNGLCHGVEELREGIFKIITVATSHPPQTVPHDEMLRQLDRVSERFRVLALKTETLIPYTSVFIELECGYWDEEREASLKTLMGK